MLALEHFLSSVHKSLYFIKTHVYMYVRDIYNYNYK